MVTQYTARLLVDSQCELGEGVIWCERRKVLYWVDIDGASLWQHVPATGNTRSWELPEKLGCIGLGQDGRLLLGLAKSLYALAQEPDVENGAPLEAKLLARVEPESGASTRMNDGRADRFGNFVFGTKSELPDGAPIGSFYQYSAKHGLRLLELPRVSIPNSICFSNDGKTMYFCDSRDGRIMRCRYDADTAGIGQVEAFVDMDVPEASPDGSCVDSEDHLWNAQWGAGRVVRYTPAGEIDRIVHVPASQASCCAIGGPGRDRLFVTSASTGLKPRELMASPHAGAVFELSLGESLGRLEDRVILP